MNNRVYSFVFISTNHMWSGSEELWFAAAEKLQEQGNMVSASVNYEDKRTNVIKHKLTSSINTVAKNSFSQRIKNRVFKTRTAHPLHDEIKILNPSLVIISQGGNLASLEVMELCISLKIKFVTLTQLVTEVHLLGINNQSYPRFLVAYKKAAKNYFVSQNNIDLHQQMLAYHDHNIELVYNPFRLKKDAVEYPNVDNGYQIAFVGRIEFFHKGIDLLLQVISAPKWQNREITFNFYGSGPHELLMHQLLKELKIQNCILHGYTNDIHDIWTLNHGLILTSRMEGQSLTLIEALLSERVCIVTKVGGASEILQDNVTGFIAGEVNIKSIDEALERAWVKKTEWEVIGKLAKDFATKNMPTDAVDFFTNKLNNLLD